MIRNVLFYLLISAVSCLSPIDVVRAETLQPNDAKPLPSDEVKKQTREPTPPNYSNELSSNESLKEICRIDNNLQFLPNELEEDTVARRIEDRGVFFSVQDIPRIRERVNNCQNYIDNQITQIKTKVSTLVSFKQSLLQNADIHQIAKQIAQNINNKERIREELRLNLAEVSLRGLFLVVLKYKSHLESKTDLSKIAKRMMTKRAVRDLNGVFLNSFASVQKGALVKEYIESRISGQMTVQKNCISKTNPLKRIYVHLSIVSVSPLKAGIKQNLPYDAKGYEHVVFHLGEDNFKKGLKDFGVPTDQIDMVEKKLQTFLPIVIKENEREERREQYVIKDTLRKLNNIDLKIAELHQDIKKKRALLKTAFRDIDFTCQKIDTPEACISEAIARIDQRIESNKKRLMAIKGNELILMESRVLAESDPARDIAKQALGLVNQVLPTYSTVEKLLERTEVEDGVLSDYQMERDVSIVRKLDRFWIYIIPRMEDSFGLMLVVKFKIKDQKESQPLKVAKTSQPPIASTKPGPKHQPVEIRTATDAHPRNGTEENKEIADEKVFSAIKKSDSASKPLPFEPKEEVSKGLRSRPMSLSAKAVKEMLSKFNFFDKNMNEKGDGIENDFVETGNGIVIDRSTGLMWQKGESIFPFKFGDAVRYVAEMNDKGVGGYNDWRLPTLEEFASLMESSLAPKDDLHTPISDMGVMSPPEIRKRAYIDPVFDQDSLNWFWSADYSPSGKSWAANFRNGFLEICPRDYCLSVKAVRTAQ